MPTDVTTQIRPLFQIQAELTDLEQKRYHLDTQIGQLRSAIREIKEQQFLAEFATLCNTHGMRIHGSADRDGIVDLYVDSLNGSTVTAKTVLELVE